MIHNNWEDALSAPGVPATPNRNDFDSIHREGPSRVEAPSPTLELGRAADPNRDLYARDDLENEWWYYHGRLSNGSRTFGFHLAFFRRRTDRIRLAEVFPLRLAQEQIRFAHFGLADIDRRQFHYGHQRSLWSDAGASADRFSVWMRDWLAEERNGVHHLLAKIRGVEIELQLTPVKPLVRNGQNGSFPKCGHGHSTYVSIPRMNATGRLRIDGELLAVTGEAWMDREFGDFRFSKELCGWDWLAVQFNDSSELLVYRLRDDRGKQTDYSMATLIGANGEVKRLDASQFALSPIENWRSQRTGIVYPLGWQFRADDIGADLRIEPLIRCCELDTRGSTSVFYWEGPVQAHGQILGRSTPGTGYLELAGYAGDRARIGQYDFASDSVGIFGWIANEIRLRLQGPGLRATDAPHEFSESRSCFGQAANEQPRSQALPGNGLSRGSAS